MIGSISIQNVDTKLDRVKFAQGVLLALVAVIVAVGIAMVAVPTCIWQLLIGAVANQLGANFPIPDESMFEAQYGQPNIAAVIAGLLVALYPAYHAVWRLRESLGYDCSAPVFCKRTNRRIAALGACVLLAALVMAYGLKTVLAGDASGDTSAEQMGCIIMFVAPLIIPACAVACLLKWLVSRGPAKQWGIGKFVPELLHMADVALNNVSSNFVLLFFGELIANVLATVFLAALIVAAFIAMFLAITAVCLVVTLVVITFGLPILVAASRDN